MGLSDQQKSQAKALFAANRAQNKPLFVTMMTEKQQLRTLIHSGNADEASIRELRLDRRSGFLGKPYRRADLAGELARVFDDSPASANGG